MKFFDTVAGVEIERLDMARAYQDYCITLDGSCETCPFPNGTNRARYHTDSHCFFCDEFRIKEPVYTAPFYKCEVIYEPGDAGYVEETLDVDDTEVFGLLGF